MMFSWISLVPPPMSSAGRCRYGSTMAGVGVRDHPQLPRQLQRGLKCATQQHIHRDLGDARRRSGCLTVEQPNGFAHAQCLDGVGVGVEFAEREQRVVAVRPGFGCEPAQRRRPVELDVTADGRTLFGHGGDREIPAVGRTAQQHLVGDEDVVEEDLVEMRLPGRRFDRLDLYPGGSHIEDEIADAAVLAGFGVGARQQRAQVGVLRQRRPDLVAVDPPAAIDLGRPGGQRREVGAGSRLAEQLAPRDVATLRRRDQALLQVFWCGGQDRGQDPLGDVQRWPNQPGSLGELLVDDELFEGIRIDAPRRRPVRRHETGVGDQRALRPGSEMLIVAVRCGFIVAQLQGRIQRLGDPGPEVRLRVTQIDRHVALLRAGQLSQHPGPAIRRTDRSRQADGPPPVQVHIVFPSETDGAEHRQGVEHQIRHRRDRDHRRTRRGQPVLVQRFVRGTHRVPGRRGGQLAVDQKHRRAVLQRLERPNHLAELLPSAQVRGDDVDAPLRYTGRRAGHQPHHDTCRAVGVDSGENVARVGAIIVESQNPHVADEVSAVRRFDRRGGLAGVHRHPHHLAVAGAGSKQDHARRACARDDLRRAGDEPSLPVGARLEVTVAGQNHGGGSPRCQLAHQRFSGRRGIGQQRNGSRRHGRQQRAG